MQKCSDSLQSKPDEQQQERLHIDTLHDIDDDVVVLTTKPGMGKSTLFTHLFLQTKKVDQTMWIVRINFIEHCRQFFSSFIQQTVLVSYEILASVAELFLTSGTQKMYKHLELFIGDRKT
ncbi:hypothetical protein PYW08_012718 [Mythimna loreyi]|uniref:Uncharacterized protein n=1 Tax=Mythimna loreyi TaxID=667449 RepID=A0ACC2Q3R1_9NEOP|nr:hypothetical protein PYW08_012718 [Mythimna loreyi]